MLPMLLGLAGSGLAGAGMLGGMGALTAGALGSGLGSYIETGDLGQGIQTGLMSFLGGKALGSLMGSGAAATGATPAALQPGAELASSGMGVEGLGSGTFVNAANPAQGALLGPPATSGMVYNDMGRLVTPGAAPAASSGNMFSNMFKDSTAGIGNSIPADATMGQRFSGATGALMTPESIGAGLGTALSIPPPDFEKKKKNFNTEEAEAYDKKQFTPGAGFRPGIDKEFDYFGPAQFANGGITDLRYAEGGDMNMAGKPNDKELINDAVDAIQGKDESPERTLAMFVSRYGEDALRDLVQKVQSGESDANAEATEGKVNGVGDGMDDMIPATLEGEQDVVLSDGEFIVPADVVSGLGNGSTDAGSKSLYEMMDRVREMRTGGTAQPKQVPQERMLPV